ncbi:MAG: magnesium/cobalt transporter CorA [Candidatus Zixiibacteriota bacterium]
MRFFGKTSKKAGQSPGTLALTDEAAAGAAEITVIDYNEAELYESEVDSAAECAPFRDKPSVTWVNVDGLERTDVLAQLGACFDLHDLVIEDIANTEQRPKIEDYGSYLFVVLKMLYLDNGAIRTEQVSLVLGPDYVLSFQERAGDVFDLIRGRLRSAKGRIRKRGADYLAYAIIDAVVDNYFVILEQVGERVADLEDELTQNPTPETLRRIHSLKREMILLRKSVWPLREVVNSLGRDDISLVSEGTAVFLRDVYDHTIQVIDAVETYRDVLSGMLDLYISTVSNKMNEVMKVLTIIATVFIPLTFIAGVYGMNFRYMPELGWQWSYLVVWLVMLGVAGAMFIFFKVKKWL